MFPVQELSKGKVQTKMDIITGYLLCYYLDCCAVTCRIMEIMPDFSYIYNGSTTFL